MNTSHEVDHTFTGGSSTTSWFDKFLLNFFSYLLVLVPIGIIVLATRYRLGPTSLRSSFLVQRFVYGCDTARNDQKGSSQDNEDTNRLLTDDTLSVNEQEKPNQVHVTKSTIKFIWCFVGLQTSYLVWGILQEKIMTTEYHTNAAYDTDSSPITFHDSQFLVFINRLISFLLSIVALLLDRPKQPTKPQAPLYEYIYSSLSNVLSSWCQYEALKYVSFSTQVLSKSCKIVAVMLMSKLVLKRKYQLIDYICALVLSVGMFIFLLHQPSKVNKGQDDHQTHQLEPKSSFLTSGLIILSLYLAFDSFTSNWQQSLFSRYSVTRWDMMAATNFYSILLTLTSLYQLGNLKPAFKLLASSTSLLTDCLIMSIMSSVGQLFVYYTIEQFGSVLFSVIMTLRQFLAILLSCAIYGHALTMGSVIGLSIVFFIVGIKTWRDYRSSSLNKAKKSSTESNNSRIQFESVMKK